MCIPDQRVYRGRLTFLPVENYTGKCTATSALPADLRECLYRPEPVSAVGVESERAEPAKLVARYLPPLSEPIAVRNGWSVIEGEFVALSLLARSHLATIALVFPQFDRADGALRVSVGRAESVTRGNMLTFLKNSALNGTLQGPGSETICVRAFRLEPLGPLAPVGAVGPLGTLAVDGEQIECGPVQGEVLPGAGALMARPLPMPSAR